MRLLLVLGLLLCLRGVASAQPLQLLPAPLRAPVALASDGDDWAGQKDGWTKAPPTPRARQLRTWGLLGLGAGLAAVVVGGLLALEGDGLAEVAGVALLWAGAPVAAVGGILLTAGLVLDHDPPQEAEAPARRRALALGFAARF